MGFPPAHRMPVLVARFVRAWPLILLLGVAPLAAAAEFDSNPCEMDDEYGDLTGMDMLRAAKQGHVSAQFNLAVSYDEGSDGFKKDQKKSTHWYLQAAKQGHMCSQFNLALAYENGNGIDIDPEEAFRWYVKAAEQGDSDAQFNLAACYEEATGTPQDYTLALFWYRKSAEQDDPDAQFEVGNFYANGMGVTQDIKQAMAWYRKAAEQGHEGAFDVLETLQSKDTAL